MGGQSYEYMGLYGDYFKDRGTPLTDADEGRFAQTERSIRYASLQSANFT